MTVDFDQTESPGHKELHKVGDPISIRVKEPAFENHANEDDLLNKVFESETAPVSAAQLEQTVEKIVAKVLAEKVEVLLVDAIERAVTKEIERLKAQLLGAPGSDA
jgi:methylmalonyl-CoA mutase cobalamin-binding subunit